MLYTGKEAKAHDVCVCVCFLPIHSGHQWTYQPGSHRRKVTQDEPKYYTCSEGLDAFRFCLNRSTGSGIGFKYGELEPITF